MKKILIMYATYGTGHKKIAQYIEKYFKQNGNFEIELIDILKFSTPVLGSLTEKTFEKINFSIPYLWDIIYSTFNRKLKLFPKKTIVMSTFKCKGLKKKILEFNPDLVISTHYFCSTIISQYKKKDKLNSKLITIVTDYEAHEFWLDNEKYEDYLVIGNSIEKKELVKRGIEKKKITDIGIPVSDDFNPNMYNRNKTIREYKLDANKKTLIFFCSRGKITSKYAKEILKSNLNCNILIVTGNNTKLKNELKEIKAFYDNPNIKILGYINNVPELLNIADIVITKPGGATVTECLYFNVPMLFVGKSSGQEKANAKYLGKQKCSISVNNCIDMIKTIEYLFNNQKKLDRLKNNIQKINKNDAMPKLFKLVEKVLEDVK